MKKRILTLLLLTLLLGACTASPEFGPEMAETFVDEGAIIQEGDAPGGHHAARRWAGHS
jgi:hypothetical protein